MWDNDHPMKAIMDLGCIWHRVLEQRMSDLGLTSIQSRILGYLYFQTRQNKMVLQRELEEQFKIRKSSVTSVLQTLEKKGLVNRELVPGDARQKLLTVTEKGIEVQETVMQRLDLLEDMVRDYLSAEEQQMFFACISKIETRLKEAEYD